MSRKMTEFTETEVDELIDLLSNCPVLLSQGKVDAAVNVIKDAISLIQSVVKECNPTKN